MFLVIILLPLVMQSGVAVKQASLVEMQVRASVAHKAYREKARGAQRCEAQTATANAAAAKAASEASQRRRQLLTALASRAIGPSAAGPVRHPDGGELGQAIALLSKDMEISAAMMEKADPKLEAAGTRGFLAEAATLPQPGVLAGAAGEAGLDVKSVVASVLGDLGTEESLLGAYFSSSKLENERACLVKAEPEADPFRVPARSKRPSKGAKR